MCLSLVHVFSATVPHAVLVRHCAVCWAWHAAWWASLVNVVIGSLERSRSADLFGSPMVTRR